MSRFSGCSRALTPSRNSEATIEVEPDNASTPVSLIVPPGHTWSRATNSQIVMNGAVDRLAKRRQCTGTYRHDAVCRTGEIAGAPFGFESNVFRQANAGCGS